MRKKRLLNRSEMKVKNVLEGSFHGSQYRVYVQVRLNSVVEKEPGEYLPQEEFDFLRAAELDFVVVACSGDQDPIFAIEFDGPFHSDPRVVRRDVLKNRLLKKAGLPLLRIGAAEIVEHEKVTLLDYMVQRYLSWQRHEEDLIRLAGDPSFDPTFEFDLRHPFPGTREVCQRLFRRYGIAGTLYVPRAPRRILYWFHVHMRTEGPDEDEQHLKCVNEVALFQGCSSAGIALFEAEVAASLRCWLPTQVNIPEPPPFFSEQWAEDFQSMMELRIQAMWFPDLSGIYAWGVARHFADYLACRAVEDWAKNHIPTNSA